MSSYLAPFTLWCFQMGLNEALTPQFCLQTEKKNSNSKLLLLALEKVAHLSIRLTAPAPHPWQGAFLFSIAETITRLIGYCRHNSHLRVVFCFTSVVISLFSNSTTDAYSYFPSHKIIFFHFSRLFLNFFLASSRFSLYSKLFTWTMTGVLFADPEIICA